VIEPPLGEPSFGITLFGNGIDFTNNLLLAIERMGQNGLGREAIRFSPEVYSGKRLIYKDGIVYGKPFVMSLAEHIAERPRSAKRWKVSFLTPTRIVHGGRIMRAFSLAGVVSSLIRRLSLIISLHQDPAFNLKLPALEEFIGGVDVLEDNTKAVQYEGYSSRQGRRLRLQGFTGDIILSGGGEELWALLVAGEIIHVGKGTSFGFGTYKIEEV
jgi:hypothetical protein